MHSQGDLHFVPGARIPTLWHRNLWLEPHELTFDSISDAAKQLRQLGGLWSAQSTQHYRRSTLIQDRLPTFHPRLKPFPFLVPNTALGSWALIEEHRLWASPRCSSPFAGGIPPLLENKIDPPSSAYLKLQEAFLLYGQWPQPGQTCLDAGSSPGGWTWVLAQTGALVQSVDRAPLDSRLMTHPQIRFRTGNAFALKPTDFGPLDWFCSDVICYPSKLWDWITLWLEAQTVQHFIVTIKMQGKDCDWTTLERFASVPGSRLLHLAHNKHEVTWML